MAEIAISMFALGSMYILSNQGEKDGYENMKIKQVPEGRLPNKEPINLVQNYPVQKMKELGENTSFYPSPNAATDRYYQQDAYEKAVENEQTPDNNLQFKSLTGDSVQKKDIKFNNMVPFFGAKITGQTFDYDKGASSSILDNRTGSGQHFIKKKAQAPLFKPTANMGWSHGAPNMSDFYQSRVNPSRNISNNKPWEEKQVGPGLNQGYSAEGMNGFNAGMMARKEWLPKNVDQLRNVTNPKVTYSLENHKGPANSFIKTRGVEGKVEKQRPDTYYENTPDRWFTTGGQEKAQTARAEQPMEPVNRQFTTQEYYGTGGGDVNGAEGTRVDSIYKPSNKVTLDGPDKYPGIAHNLNTANKMTNLKHNYGKSGYKSLPNARSTTVHNRQMGIVGGWFKAAVAPLMDVLRPSRKENVIGNIRPNGNAGGAYGVNNARVWNPADRTKTTIKEQTIVNRYQAQPAHDHGGGYATSKYQRYDNQRDTTNGPVTGPIGPTPFTTKSGSQQAARNANLNPNKEIISQSRPGAAGPTNHIEKGGYGNVEYQRYDNQRDTTNCPVTGPIGPTPFTTKSGSQQAARNARLNPNRQIVSQSRPGGAGPTHQTEKSGSQQAARNARLNPNRQIISQSRPGGAGPTQQTEKSGSQQAARNARLNPNKEIVSQSRGGGAGATPGSQKAGSQVAARNAYLNPDREIVSKSRANGGNMDMFNSNMNIRSSKIGTTVSAQGLANMPKQSFAAENIGSIGYKNNRDSTVGISRTDGDLLSAFNNNPYTHSLSSVA